MSEGERSLSPPVHFRPVAQAVEYGDEGVAGGGGGVFHADGDFQIFMAGDEAVALKLLQGGGEDGIGYAVKALLQRVVAHGAGAVERADYLHFPLAAYYGHGIMQRAGLKAGAVVMGGHHVSFSLLCNKIMRYCAADALSIQYIQLKINSR